MIYFQDIREIEKVWEMFENNFKDTKKITMMKNITSIIGSRIEIDITC